MLCKELYRELHNIQPVSAEVLKTYQYLEPDQYLQGEYLFRYRAYSTGELRAQRVTWLEQSGFFQSKEINQYAGGIQRVFQPLSVHFREWVTELILSVRTQPLFSDNAYAIGVHQIRITAEGGHLGYPVPEGPHQDGFDLVSIHCLNVSNVDGGTTSLFEGSAQGRLLFSEKLEEGMGVIVNDREVFHYTSPIQSISGAIGFRDMCVITYNRL